MDNLISSVNSQADCSEDQGSLVDLVMTSDTSVRLRNAIWQASLAGTLPFETVEDYLAAGRLAPVRVSRNVKNFGRKSSAELEALIRGLPRSPTPNGTVLRERIMLMLSEKPIEEVLDLSELPSRIQSALQTTGLRAISFRSLVERFADLHAQLIGMQNVGRDSVNALENALKNKAQQTLLSLASSALDPDMLVSFIFEGSAPKGEVLRQLSSALENQQLQPAPDSEVVEEPILPVGELVSVAIATLGDRERDIVLRRFGIGGEKETLEEVGQSYRVTRERIRQIESKALRRMRAKFRVAAKRSCLECGEGLWRKIALNGALTAHELDARRQLAPPEWALCLEICGLAPEQCFSRVAREWQGGWVDSAIEVENLEEIQTHTKVVINEFMLPTNLHLVGAGQDVLLSDIAARFAGFWQYGGYLVRERPRPRIRRALRLHALFSGLEDWIDIRQLLAAYRAQFRDDQCSTRDLDIVLASNPQLFIEITDGKWRPVGRCLPELVVDGSESYFADNDALEEMPESGGSDPSTNADALEAAFRIGGPLRLSELIDKADRILPPGRSVNSIGPTLITSSDRFDRPLPGLYCLPGQIPPLKDLMRNPPSYVLDEEQIRVFALSRWANEPWGLFPLWEPELEVVWCRWAKQHGEASLLNSLLTVADIHGWPVDQSEKEIWLSFAVTRKRFSLQFAARTDAFTRPDINAVLRACMLITKTGQFGWISANRVMQRRAADHVSVGLLGVLVGAGVLKAADHWQKPHFIGEDASLWLEKLSNERQRHGKLRWDGDAGQALLRRCQITNQSMGWLTMKTLSEIVNSEEIYGLSEVSLDEFLHDNAKVSDADMFEDLLAQLSADRP